jgi:hypothetical protein
MSYGVRINDSKGKRIVDSALFGNGRFIYSTIASAGENGSVTLTNIAGTRTIALSLPINFDGVLSHITARNGNVISWTERHVTSVTTSDSVIIVVCCDGG